MRKRVYLRGFATLLCAIMMGAIIISSDRKLPVRLPDAEDVVSPLNDMPPKDSELEE